MGKTLEEIDYIFASDATISLQLQAVDDALNIHDKGLAAHLESA
jgi:hypothetical protein